jgi:hypothetical protein
MDTGKPRKISVRTASVPAKILTENIQSTSLEHYRYTSLLHGTTITMTEVLEIPYGYPVVYSSLKDMLLKQST